MVMVVQFDIRSFFGIYCVEGWVWVVWWLVDWYDLLKFLCKCIWVFVVKVFFGFYDLEVEGLKFWIYLGENYDDCKILVKGCLLECVEYKLIVFYFGEGKVFVDIGVNIGFYLIFVVGYGVEVLVIEVNLKIVYKLCFNIVVNVLNIVWVINVVVGLCDGMMDFWIELFNFGFVIFVKDLIIGEWVGDWLVKMVEIYFLMVLIDEVELKWIDILKVDVEGFEDCVLLFFLWYVEFSLWFCVIFLEMNCWFYWFEDCLYELVS